MPQAQVTILFVLGSNGSQVGGMEKQLSLQVRQLCSLDRFKVIVTAHPAYQALFSFPNCQFEAFKTERSRYHPLSILHLKRLIDKHQAQLVHAHGAKAASLVNTTMRTIYRSRPKAIASIHGTKKKLSLYKHFDKVFVVSESLAKHLLPLPSVVLWNAIEPYEGTQLSKAEVCDQYELNHDYPLIVAAGRLAPVKNYAQLMQAAGELDINLLILGDGPEYQNLDAFQTSKIKLAGHIEEAQSIIAAADALVISSHREGLSLSMLEALQMNVPVLSSPVSGAKDLLPSQLLLNIDSVEDLRHSLKTKLNLLVQSDTLEMAESEKKMQQELKVEMNLLYERVKRDFSIEAVVSKLITHYDLLLKSQ